MHGLALALLCLTFSQEPTCLTTDDDPTDLQRGDDGRTQLDLVELTADVQEVKGRRFLMPMVVEQPERIKAIKLFVSEDGGRSWKFVKEYEPTAKHVEFEAPRDGHYWFALQIVSTDGKSYPATTADLVAERKAYVNAEHKVLKPTKSGEEPERKQEREP